MTHSIAKAGVAPWKRRLGRADADNLELVALAAWERLSFYGTHRHLAEASKCLGSLCTGSGELFPLCENAYIHQDVACSYDPMSLGDERRCYRRLPLKGSFQMSFQALMARSP